MKRNQRTTTKTAHSSLRRTSVRQGAACMMSALKMNLYDERQVMEEFICCYQHHNALWDSNNKAYASKRKREPGYQELLKILRRVNHEASIEDVKRKINSLRCCYRRETRKALANGVEPRLWWFHHMDFLKPVLNMSSSAVSEQPAGTARTNSCSFPIKMDHSSSGEEQEPEEDEQQRQEEEQEHSINEEEMFNAANYSDPIEEEDDLETDNDALANVDLKPPDHKLSNGSTDYAPANTHAPSSSSSVRRVQVKRQSNESKKGCRSHSSQPQSMQTEALLADDSECELIGRRMAAHFRNMRPDQRLYAERIIGEVLLYGRMNRLSMDASFALGDSQHL